MPRLSPDEINRLRAGLPDDVERIAFHEGTEPPGCSPLNAEKRAGTYHCRVCGEALFSSTAKYESGSGWPSFFEPVSAGAIGTRRDFKLILPRTEFHCANCGAHGGHVFNDGPRPTGQRWCANGLVLDFRPASEE
ncbi:peptide-methionine (R)-S-oxide reductase MsrB [Synechococcus sp. BA-132 BA5]|uniref:peptide-methionine (R)-S-oxide reductase MsrB n=1 Tax=Synechococcus sp. BA-132 BA5 TaxID=3110252 RepID=UPI002B217F98|nr:peptide-methionine (R)-S-oxide reductase MsrB [Synechococcus sp. BA-132 BA5]MEA5414997.1 peptide-methionine (R)-S-oxide reductase MsrB [Synechococcus sp. BA-132 BA5]